MLGRRPRPLIRSRREAEARRRAAVLALVVLVPGTVAFLAVFRPQWYPAGDMAQAELHVRGIWRHPPLVGAAGRIFGSAGVQGSHPGPALWFALYPVYLLFGRSSTGLLASVVVVHAVSAWIALALAWRRGGRALATAVAGVLVLLVRASGPNFLVEPWNPWLAVLPFLVFLLACWSVLEGDRHLLWLAVGAGSFAIQCHVGYALVVLGLLGPTVVWATAAGRRELPRVGADLAVAAAVGAAMWAPPVLDQIRRRPGNLTLLREHFLHPSEPVFTWGQARHVVSLQFNALGPWLTGPTSTRTSALGLMLLVAGWAAAVTIAVRRRDVPALRLHGLLGLGVVLGAVSVKRLFGPYFEYTTRWSWVLTATVVAASLWTLWRARPDRVRPAVARWVATIVLVGLVVGVSAQVGARAEPPGPQDSALLRGLAPLAAGRLDPGARYLLRWHDPTGLGAVGFGLLLALERRGLHVGADAPVAAGVLPHRVTSPDRVDAVLYLVVGRRIDAVRAQEGVEMVAYYDPRTVEQRQRTEQLLAELSPYLPDPEVPVLGGPALPLDAAQALIELNSIRQPAALFETAPGTVVDALAG